MASSGDERGRLGVARRPENRDRPPRRQRHSDGRLREASAPLLRRAAQEDGRWVYDRWGPRVRKFLNLNPKFWIVTPAGPSPRKIRHRLDAIVELVELVQAGTRPVLSILCSPAKPPLCSSIDRRIVVQPSRIVPSISSVYVYSSPNDYLVTCLVVSLPPHPYPPIEFLPQLLGNCIFNLLPTNRVPPIAWKTVSLL